MLPYVMTYNRQACLQEMAEIADALNLAIGGHAAEEKADAAIAEVARLFEAIGITPTLAKLGLPEDKLDWTADQAVGIERLIKNNPRTIDLAAMKRLVRAAYDGDLSAAR
jgi:alcohol dehydrogenase